MGIPKSSMAERAREVAHLRCSVENDVVQPDIDHVEEPTMEYGRPARPSLEQPPLSQELFQYMPR